MAQTTLPDAAHISSSDKATIHKMDQQFVHPWDRPNLLEENERTIMMSGSGVMLEDIDGNEIFDGPGGMWSLNLGHGADEIVDAMAEQGKRLIYSTPWGTANLPSAEIASRLADLAPGDLNRVFLTTGGSTANDTALRFIAFYNNLLGRPEKKHIIARQHAYHGSTLLSASVSGKERDKSHLDTLTEMVTFLTAPNPYRRPDDLTESEFCDFLVDEFEHTIARIGPDKIAAYIAEPIMGAGGVIVPPEGYNKRMWQTCRKHDIVYISDEVVTGFGRLGHFFSSKDVFDVEPDIITCAKGLTAGYAPLGAAIVSERLFNNLKQACGDDPAIIFSNGYTYSGHPIACAAALKTIEIMERDDIMPHARKVGAYFQEKMRSLYDLPLVGDVRGLGLMAAIEANEHIHGDLDQDKAIGNMIDEHCQMLGLLVRPIINVCVLSPPLTLTTEHVDKIVGTLGEGIKRAHHDLAKDGVVSVDA